MGSAYESWIARTSMAGEGPLAVSGAGAQRVENGLCSLAEQCVIEVSGADAEGFLQGQLTGDITQVDEGRWGVSAYCTPNGRMIAAMRIARHGERYLMVLPEGSAAPLLKRLPMFIMMSSVKLESASERLVSLGCWGPAVAQYLEEQGRLPGGVGQATSGDGGVVLQLPGEALRFLIAGEVEWMGSLWDEIAARAERVDPVGWKLLEIRAGCPTLYGATSEAFVPQMCNLQRIGGVSFTKGCYVGQEVVARMQYLGKLKRRMFLARSETGRAPQPGDALFSAASDSGQGAGQVVDAAPSPDGGWELLAVVEVSAAEAGEPLRLFDPKGPEVALTPPPYGFDDAK